MARDKLVWKFSFVWDLLWIIFLHEWPHLIPIIIFRETQGTSAAGGAAAAKLLQSCLTLYDAIDGSPQGSPAPPSLGFSRQEHWSGLPFLLQCKKVKSESEVTQSCPYLSDPMDCSLPGSSVHGIFQAGVLTSSKYNAQCDAQILKKALKIVYQI